MLSTKFQVDTCKTKKKEICSCAVAHLVVEIQDMIYNAARVSGLFTKFQVDTCKIKKDRSAHAQLRTLQLRSKPWFMMRQGSVGYVQKFKLMRKKKNIYIFWGVIFAALGGGGLDYGQYQILTDSSNGLKNLCTHFGNNRPHRLGGVWWQTDKQTTDDRQTEKLNPSMSYDTFVCFAGLMKKKINK